MFLKKLLNSTSNIKWQRVYDVLALKEPNLNVFELVKQSEHGMVIVLRCDSATRKILQKQLVCMRQLVKVLGCQKDFLFGRHS